MTRALVVTSHGPHAPPLAEDLREVGIDPVVVDECTGLLQTVIQTAPDLIVCFEQSPGPALFAAFEAIRVTTPRPVAMFTTDPDAGKIAVAMRSGINAYVVAGYGRNRLRSVIHLAQARFREEQLLRTELADVQRRFEERKLVDRAKGILMGARNLREEEAYRALRTAAMAAKQRIGQMSQTVIDSAHYAEAVNRAGQLRMLSQRLVKLYALLCAGVDPAETKGLLADSEGQIESVLAILRRNVSQPTFGDLVAAVAGPWVRLQALLQAESRIARLPEIDALAEEMLEHSERLTANLEVAAYANGLRAINVAGRQRMLSQRLAKEAVVLTLSPRSADGMARTAAELEQGMGFLHSLPLSNAEIARELDQTDGVWLAFQAAVAQRDRSDGCTRIATLSEEMLGHFDRLTAMLERAIQAFIS